MLFHVESNTQITHDHSLESSCGALFNVPLGVLLIYSGKIPFLNFPKKQVIDDSIVVTSVDRVIMNHAPFCMA
jgi:hypothetical protein